MNDSRETCVIVPNREKKVSINYIFNLVPS